ncbi:hypothetical protein CERSUDRAFT_92126 [Gelatoporia subvermispora B]|uniref:Uncharacterized protein n=1 Tax=Ceriporiopsis subvermispora (strain B) TaxID=914234 RepID=M2PSI7_CERS8|nr:hypothetical protein CERSUDRAFT_92126 [Gelatoporia subvermispora B]
MLAISDRNVLLSAAVLLLNLIPVGSNAYTDFASSWEQIKNLPLLGVVCDSGSNLSPTALTKTWHVKRDADRNHVRTPLATLLFRDGTIYFIILLSSNVLNIVANGSNVFVFSVTFFSTPISSIIIADFLLNLRQIASSSQLGGLDETIQTEDQSHTFSGSLRFQGFVDNMGEEVVHSYDTSDPDMAWGDNATDDDLSTSACAAQRTVGSKLRDSFISLGSDEEFVRVVVGGTTSFSAV